MSQWSHRRSTVLAVASALLMFAMAGLVGGNGFDGDVSAIVTLTAERAAHGRLADAAIATTHVGGAPGMVIILAIACALLVVARRFRDAIALAAIVLSGRIAIELLKLAIGRPRPDFSPYPVKVTSLSFPSGHAGNSMMTFLALAVIAAPARWRGLAVTAAVLASVAIGATRPFLGVHWPSDVIGGWAFGFAWVTALVALSERWRLATKQ